MKHRFSDDVLLTWLIVMRLNLRIDGDDGECEGELSIPRAIKMALTERDWLSWEHDPEDEPGTDVVHITQAGIDASDVFGPESGVDVVQAAINCGKKGYYE